MKKQDQKAIQDLKKRRESAKQSGNWTKVSDTTLELAQNYRNHGQKDEAIEEFEYVLDIAAKARELTDTILAVRGLAEIHSENGDNFLCKHFLNKFEELVKGDPTEYQLMLTVAAYCMIKLHITDEKNEKLLKEGKQYAKRSLEMLTTEEMDTKSMLAGDSKLIRELNCHRMLAEIAAYLNNKEDGERHSKLAFDLAAGRKDSQFEILRARLDFPWREDKVKAAEDLSVLATTNPLLKCKRVEADNFLAEAHFEREDIKKGEDVLLQIYEAANAKSSAADDREKHSELLIFAFKASTRVEKLREFTKNGDQAGQFRMNDKLGDLYHAAGFKKAALRYYKASKIVAETDREKRSALISCAQTSYDLKLYRDAAGYFDLVRQIENRMGKDISETLVCYFQMRLLAGIFTSDADVNMEVDRLERDIKIMRYLKEVYDTVAKYYDKRENKKEEAERFRSLSKEVKVGKKEENEEEEEGDEEDMEDEWDDNIILEQMRSKAHDYAKKKALAKAAGKENSYGESKLIEQAREGTLDEVKFLVEQGSKVDVNKSDPAGWTPLSEAVGANNLDIAMYLLSKGADPNSKSKAGWVDSNFDGGITPLMEACMNGHCEVALRLLNLKQSNTLVVTTNLNGWSPADFMNYHIKEARRGKESEAEFQAHLTKCREVLEKIQRMQRTQGFPVRGGDPPEPPPKNGDTARFAKEKETTRRAARKDRRKGAADVYKESVDGLGSRSKLADKENKNDKRKREDDDDDLFNANYDDDDEPLLRKSTSAKKKKDVNMSSDSDDDEKKKKETRRRKSMDLDDPMFGLDDRPSISQVRTPRGGTQPKKLSGVEKLMQKKGTKRSTEKGDENGVSVVPDDFEDIEERVEIKRRKNDSESSQSESADLRLNPRHSSVNESFREQLDYETGDGRASAVVSPASVHSTKSRTSLSSASALASNTIFVKFIIVRAGVEREESFLSKAPRDSTIVDLPKHVDKLRIALDGASADYVWRGDLLDSSLTVSDVKELAEMNGLSMVEIECRVKKTMKGELHRNCDPSDRDSPLSDALHILETSRTPSLVISNGSKYRDKTREALWQLIEVFANEKTKEDAKWKAERVEVEHFDNVPASALRALIKLRPIESLSLRSCGIDDTKLDEMAEELDTIDNWKLAKVDLSFNDLIRSSDILSKMISKFKGVHSIILHGVSGIDDGRDLMKTLGGLSLITLTLNENPWLDDSCMEELMKGDGIGKLNTIQVSRTAIRTMNWMSGIRGIKSMSVAENNITASGWERVADYIRLNATALHTLDMRGTAARPVILESLAARSPTVPMLRVTITKCSLITPSEMCRALSPLVADEGRRVNLEMTIEGDKIDEVRAISVSIASRVLKIANSS